MTNKQLLNLARNLAAELEAMRLKDEIGDDFDLGTNRRSASRSTVRREFFARCVSPKPSATPSLTDASRFIAWIG
jgi:predicted DNA-binding protein (UPF0251 family)